MSNIFTQKDHSSPHLNRNSFDLSFQNNLTLRFGKYIPCFCKEVISGDTFDIDAAFGFNLDPMVYPVQSKIYINLHFYYVRNRAIWPDWKDFQFQTKDGLVPPYIDLPASSPFWQTGGIADYFNVPTDFDEVQTGMPFFPVGVLSDGLVMVDSLPLSQVNPSQNGFSMQMLYGYDSSNGIESQKYYDSFVAISGALPSWIQHNNFPLVSYATGVTSGSLYSVGSIQGLIDNGILTVGSTYNNNIGDSFYITKFFLPLGINMNNLLPESVLTLDSSSYVFRVYGDQFQIGSIFDKEREFFMVFAAYDSTTRTWNFVRDLTPVSGTCSAMDVIGASYTRLMSFRLDNPLTQLDSLRNAMQYGGIVIPFIVIDRISSDHISDANTMFLQPPFGESLFHAVVDRFTSSNPFARNPQTGTPDCRISALPFRAYESIYNAYYRNQQNDPFTIDGQVEYNRYVTNLDGGADSTPYTLFNRYWEPDVFTTAMPSPQQGIAPLVGVNAAGVFTFRNEQTGEEYKAQALIDETDGETLTGISVHSPDMPLGDLRALQTAVQHGMSINDFRNVNALQRWLETNLRRGYKYRDLVNAHFGIDLSYNELDMPEFIGGVSKMVDVSPILNQTESNGSSVLGSMAGVASAFSQMQNGVHKYCDENGFIIGIISVAPVPTYTQSLPKFFLKTSPLDYYNPEFAKIGMQPIFNEEVTTLLAYKEDKAKEVFGYQRAWYDYMSSLDEAHGDFRTNRKDFLMMRIFGSTPELGKSFLDIDFAQVNNVFSEVRDNDKIYGRIAFKVEKKSVIPRHVIPGLE